MPGFSPCPVMMIGENRWRIRDLREREVQVVVIRSRFRKYRKRQLKVL